MVPNRSTREPTYAEYAELRAEADGRSRFVDRGCLERMEAVVRRRGGRWCSAVLGYAFAGLRSTSTVDAHLLVVADEHDIDPALPAALAEAFAAGDRRRAAQEAQRKAEEDAAQKAYETRAARWAELQQAIPVPVEVRHNYTSSRHEEGYTQGADHMYLLADLHYGRLRRLAGQVLCWTPSRSRDLEEFPHAAEETRLPTCKACWATAERIAAAVAPTAPRAASAQRELLGLIAAGKVMTVRHLGSSVVRIPSQRTTSRSGGLGRNVDTRVRALEALGWAREQTGARPYADRPWELTEAGRAVWKA